MRQIDGKFKTTGSNPVRSTKATRWTPPGPPLALKNLSQSDMSKKLLRFSLGLYALLSIAMSFFGISKSGSNDPSILQRQQNYHWVVPIMMILVSICAIALSIAAGQKALSAIQTIKGEGLSLAHRISRGIDVIAAPLAIGVTLITVYFTVVIVLGSLGWDGPMDSGLSIFFR